MTYRTLLATSLELRVATSSSRLYRLLKQLTRSHPEYRVYPGKPLRAMGITQYHGKRYLPMGMSIVILCVIVYVGG